jgi:putative restriction endonuclease
VLICEDPGQTLIIVLSILNRPFRDATFATNIKKAYSYSCAITGIKLANIDKHYEVEAAHIKPIGNNHKGPDPIRNGLALSRTFHWMFDKGLITISDKYRIITDKKLIPDQYLNLINKSGELLLPNNNKLFPRTKFLEYHRDNIFKG